MKRDLGKVPREAVSVEELSKRLGIGIKTVYRHLLDGKIPATKLGGKYIIADSTIKKILKQD